MSTRDFDKHAGKSWPIRLLALLVIVVEAFYGITCIRIVRDSGKHDRGPADALVVFGAAEYAGKPSPVYRARLDHAFQLFESGVAPVVITTGGAGADPDYSEGGVGRDYLLKRGIPEKNLIAETQGSDTAHSAERVGVIMRTNGMKTCVAVSDQYHVFRIRKLLEKQGITPLIAPRPDSRPRGILQRLLAVMREATSYLLWKLHLT
jgi:uncharacterized SAM-binding protein YcdF (DUF218 family)